MNLVAKEAWRRERREGVLMLSELAGAARELEQAVHVILRRGFVCQASLGRCDALDEQRAACAAMRQRVHRTVFDGRVSC